MNATPWMRLWISGTTRKGTDGIAELIAAGVAHKTADAVKGIIDAETNETPWPAYVRFAVGMMNRESTVQELGSFYDKIFFRAENVSRDDDGSYVLDVNAASDAGFVRLNEKIEAPIDTVGALRSKEAPGILFSGIGALEIQTKDGKAYPIIQRDAWAPTDAGKFTLPAWRWDKTPGATAMEETLEEVVIFGKKDGEWHFLAPRLDNETISEGKMLQLSQIARYKFFTSLLKGQTEESYELADTVISAKIIRVPMSEAEGGSMVTTNFKDGGEIVKSVVETGLFPMFDEKANTYEIAKKFKLDLSEFDEVTVGDGDGFGRPVRLMSAEEIRNAVDGWNCVFSLAEAVKRGILD